MSMTVHRTENCALQSNLLLKVFQKSRIAWYGGISYSIELDLRYNPHNTEFLAFQIKMK